MQLLVFLAIALVGLIVFVAVDLGGTIGALFFLLVLLIGGLLRAWTPLVEFIRGPAAKA